MLQNIDCIQILCKRLIKKGNHLEKLGQWWKEMRTRCLIKCDVIKQNELEVGINMLLVSEVLFHLNCKMLTLKSGTCRKYMIRSDNVLCKTFAWSRGMRFTSVWFQIYWYNVRSIKIIWNQQHVGTDFRLILLDYFTYVHDNFFLLAVGYIDDIFILSKKVLLLSFFFQKNQNCSNAYYL